jgi:tetratricopeptide (TPR) repeat protein
MNANVLIVLLLCGAAFSQAGLYQRALESFAEQRYEAAESLLRQAVGQQPRWFEARFLLGATLVSLGRKAEAIDQLSAAHRLNPTHLDCAKLLAAEYLGLERASEAITLLRPLLERKAVDEELLLLAIEALQVRGDAGDMEEAMQLCSRGLARYPKSPRMLAWRGYALREQGEIAGARKSLEAALALAPDDSASKAMLADVIRLEGGNEEALRLFDQVLAQNALDEEALVGKARALAAMGKLEQAIDALRIAPEVARLRLELSRLYAKLGDSDSAAREAAEFRRLRGSQTERTIPAGLRSVAPNK